jgi:glutathione S-transferase
MASPAAEWCLYANPLSGPSYKAALMLSLCGIAPELRIVDLRAGEQRTPEFLAHNPFGQVPVVAHAGHDLAQSASILEYVAAVTGRFGGASEAERAAIRAWMYWDFDRLASSVYRLRTARFGIRPLDEAVLAHYGELAAMALGLLETRLTGRAFLLGDAPTIADVDVYGTVRYCGDAGIDLSAHPAIGAWVARMEALPGWAPPERLLAAG